MLDVGQQVGDYVIEQELGGGGMAVVYRARHAVLDTVHAVKALRPSYRVDPEARRRFVEEARIMAATLDHPNIVKVTNIIATPEVAALVMELVDPAAGGSLDSWIAAQAAPPTAAAFRALVLPIIDAIGYAHGKGIIHRDLKPANVLLARAHDGAIAPKLTDFGIAKVTDAGDGKKSTHADARMGTVGYSSPEQVRKAKEVTQRSDIFSLGAMLYELATLKPAFEGASDYDVMENIVHGRFEPVAKRAPGTDKAIAAAIEKALASAPEDRFASCAELAAALRGAGRSPEPVAAPPQLASAPRSRLGGRLAVLGAAGAIVAGGLWLGLRDHGAPARTAVLDAPSIVAMAPPDASPPDAAIDAPADAAKFEYGAWKIHATVRFAKRIYYARNRFDLTPAATGVLDELIALMQADPMLGVRIYAHLTWVDEDRAIAGTQHASALGDGRLDAPYNYLVAHGIATERIEKYGYESHGSGEPVTAAVRSAQFTILAQKN